MMKLYKLLDKNTGLYAKAGINHWGTKGKVYNEIGWLRSKLIYIAKDILLNTASRQEYYRLERKGSDRQEVYSYLPDSWVVIEISEQGMREVCKAQDFYRYKDE